LSYDLQTLTRSSCAECFHNKENHYEKGVCTGDLTCRCDHYVEPFLYAFAQRVEEEKHIRKSINKRCEFILEKIPQTRNAGEKSFAKIYREIWYGFKIRKEGTKLTIEEWKRMPHDDTINREKRRCKQWNEELQTYDVKVQWEQTAIYQALLEMSIEQ